MSTSKAEDVGFEASRTILCDVQPPLTDEDVVRAVRTVAEFSVIMRPQLKIMLGRQLMVLGMLIARGDWPPPRSE